MKFIIQYKNQYIKVKANEKYFHIDKSYRFTSIKNMKNIINKIITKWLINNNCVTENGIVGYPIHYCPICGEKLK